MSTEAFVKAFTSKKVTAALLIYWAIAWIVAAWLLLTYKPWSTEVLGFAGDPARSFMCPIISLIECPPLFLFVIHQWMKHPEWMAPRGKYTPGRIYPLLGPYNVVGIVIIMAAMIASGFIVSPLFDLPIFFAWIASFYLNPWIAGWGTGLSILFRQIIWGGFSPLFAFGLAFFDWWAYSTISLVFYYVVERARAQGKRLLPYYVLIVILANLIQRALGTWHYVMWLFPGPAYLPACWAWLVGYTLGPGFATAAVALFVSELAVKITYARYKPPT